HYPFRVSRIFRQECFHVFDATSRICIASLREYEASSIGVASSEANPLVGLQRFRLHLDSCRKQHRVDCLNRLIVNQRRRGGLRLNNMNNADDHRGVTWPPKLPNNSKNCAVACANLLKTRISSIALSDSIGCDQAKCSTIS